MTIGIGFKCVDGVVVASDTQYTVGSIKTHGPKLFTLADTSDLAVAAVGAGRVSFMRRVIEGIQASLAGLSHSPTLQDIKIAAETALLEFFRKHMYPMPLDKQKDFEFEFILGAWTREGFGLFSTEETSVTAPAED